MNIKEIKDKVYQKTNVLNTAELKRERPDLTKGKDLRYKKSWQHILDALEDDYTLDDLEQDAKELHQNLHRIGRAFGQSYQQVEDTWEEINSKPIEQIFAEIEQDYLASLEVG